MTKQKLPKKVSFDSEHFKVFCSELEGKYTNEQIKFLFLKGAINLPMDRIAKILKIRYSNVLKMNKDLEEVVTNIRLDSALNILHSEKATPDSVYRAQARATRAIIDELKKRAVAADRFDGVSDKHLIEMLAKLSDNLSVGAEYYTGGIELGSAPKEKIRGHF